MEPVIYSQDLPYWLLIRSTPNEVLKAIWDDMMDHFATRAPGIRELIVDYWLSGDISDFEADIWNSRIQVCPAGGPDGHVGYRVWCCYCGDINAELCGECQRWFTQWDSPEDYDCLRFTSIEDGYDYSRCRYCYSHYERSDDYFNRCLWEARLDRNRDGKAHDPMEGREHLRLEG